MNTELLEEARMEQITQYVALTAQHLIGVQESLEDVIALAGDIRGMDMHDKLSYGYQNFLACLANANPGAGRLAIIEVCLPQYIRACWGNEESGASGA